MFKAQQLISLVLLGALSAGSAMAEPSTLPDIQPKKSETSAENSALGYLTLKTQQLSEKTSELVMQAMGLIGVPYKYGGSQPETGMDCSGFVSYVFHQALNVNLPHNANAISRMGNTIKENELRPGDLVFFNTMRRAFSHVGIYIGNNQFIHAPSTSSGAIQISDLRDTYWARRFEGARRLAATNEPQQPN